MDSNYISAPKDFRHMEGKSIDFRKTFDLNGRENDEMLRLYLRKAGMSDDINSLTADQRRSYIYDIIHSHKLPGYWLPSSKKYDPLPPPSVRPPILSPHAQRKSVDEGPNLNYRSNAMKSSSSSGSLHSLAANSSSVPNRFIPAPATPPSPSSIVTSAKGSKYEISGPTNFHHIAGDMTRDRTRNAFDLSSNPNDNVLKKYMIERGIGEDDINGMRKQDLIKKIVHSNFTWMPTKQNTEKQMPNLVYATISTNNQRTPPPSPPPLGRTEQKPTFSNYASLTSRFVDLGDEPPTGLLVSNESKSVFRPMNIPPPPPSVVTAPKANPTVNVDRIPQQTQEPMYAVIGPREKGKKIAPVATPAPPTTSFGKPTNYAPPLPPTLHAQVQNKSAGPMPPPPPPPVATMSANTVPSPMLASTTTLPISASSGKPTNSTDRMKPAPPPPTQKPIRHVGPMPSSSVPNSGKPSNKGTVTSGSIPPPPPPQMPSKLSATVPPPPPMPTMNVGPVPPPPPPPMPNASGGPLPPPPPPTQLMPPGTALKKASSSEVLNGSNNQGDDRDALLNSIRKGITLKKVDRKSATISGVKPAAQRRPPVTDFLTELRMRQGITLNRIKNPSDNPYADSQLDESHA